MNITFETLQDGKIKETKTYTRMDGVEVDEKRTLLLSEAEAAVAIELSQAEKSRDDLVAKIVELKKKRDDFVALRRN